MKKRFWALLLVLIMAASLVIPAAAYEDHYYTYTDISAIDNDRIAELGEETLPFVSEQAQFDLRVDIVDDLNGNSIEEHAAIFYEQYEYGWGENKDGALLMICLQDNGDGVDFVTNTVYGFGRGAEVLDSADSALLYQTLGLTLIGTDVAYEEAGEICADAIEIYMGYMITLLNPVEEELPVADAAPAAEAETETDTQAAEAVVEYTDAVVEDVETPAAVQDEGFIRDEAELLSTFSQATLEGQAANLAETYGCGVYVLTVDTMDGATSREFAKEYYLDHDLGVGEGNNGILFMVAMDTRDYVTVTYGLASATEGGYGIGIQAFTDDGIAALEDEVVSYLSDGDYDGAFSAYLDICEEYLNYYDENGEGMAPADSGSLLLKLAIVILVPLLIALGVCLVFVSQMKTARIATEAGNYIADDSFALTAHQDRYTHTTKTRTKIEKNDSSGSSIDSDGFGGSRGGKF